MINTNLRGYHKRICKSEQGRLEYVEKLSCIKETDLLILHTLFNKVANYFNLVSTTASANDVIPKACCAWVLLYEEMVTMYHSLCPGKQFPGAAEFHISVVQSIVGDALELACGRFSTIDHCRKDPSIGMPRLESMEIKALNHSLLVPLINIVKLLDSDVDPGKD